MDNEFDNVPDDFGDLDNIDWDVLLSTDFPSHYTQPTVPQPQNPSSFPDFDDYYDSATLAEIDELERQALALPPLPPLDDAASEVNPTQTLSADAVSEREGHSRDQGQQTLVRHDSSITVVQLPSEQDTVSGDDVQVTRLGKRRRSRSESESPRKKPNSESAASGSAHLNELEEELTCPICQDIFILTKLANPCGHSFCEPCGVMWFKKKSRCAVCRTQLWWTCPMLPNVAMDNTVEKYIKMLASSGQDEWKDNGEKYKEWVDRKEKWRREVAEEKDREQEKENVPQAEVASPSLEDDANRVYQIEAYNAQSWSSPRRRGHRRRAR